MQAKAPTFLTYAEAVAAAKVAPNIDFIGLRFAAPYKHLAAYVISVDSDEPDYINVAYSAGDMFSDCGEEDFFADDDAPDEAKTLFYASQRELGNGDPQVTGMTSEYVLFEVLPGLQEPDTYELEAEFNREAGRVFKSFWRHA